MERIMEQALHESGLPGHGSSSIPAALTLEDYQLQIMAREDLSVTPSSSETMDLSWTLDSSSDASDFTRPSRASPFDYAQTFTGKDASPAFQQPVCCSGAIPAPLSVAQPPALFDTANNFPMPMACTAEPYFSLPIHSHEAAAPTCVLAPTEVPAGLAESRKNAVRVTNACTSCRAKKVRCDGNEACAKCQKLGIACEYKPVSPEDNLKLRAKKQRTKDRKKLAAQVEADFRKRTRIYADAERFRGSSLSRDEGPAAWVESNVDAADTTTISAAHEFMPVLLRPVPMPPSFPSASISKTAEQISAWAKEILWRDVPIGPEDAFLHLADAAAASSSTWDQMSPDLEFFPEEEQLLPTGLVG